jgi:1-acyl-sn-glycerol-3-phosphate acyltransferase
MIGSFFKKSKLESLKKRGLKEESKKYLKATIFKWTRMVIKKTEIDVEFIGKENIPEGSCLFVCNHQSHLDIPVIIENINEIVGFVAKKELEKFGILRYWMSEIHCVFIDRENPREGLKAILEGAKNLKNGYPMAIFPEGTRSKSDKIGEFKKGSMKMAIKAGVPIVPLTIDGTYKALEGWKKENKKVHIRLIADEAIDVKELTKEEKAELHLRVREVIARNLSAQ